MPMAVVWKSNEELLKENEILRKQARWWWELSVHTFEKQELAELEPQSARLIIKMIANTKFKIVSDSLVGWITNEDMIYRAWALWALTLLENEIAEYHQIGVETKKQYITDNNQ